MEIKIDNKTYNYFVKRQHFGLFTKIIAKLIDPDQFEKFKSKNEFVLMIKMIKEACFTFNASDPDTLIFIAAIYNVPEKEIEEMGLFKELRLWKNFIRDEEFKDFFSLAYIPTGLKNKI
jgi:hypothetical protein